MSEHICFEDIWECIEKWNLVQKNLKLSGVNIIWVYDKVSDLSPVLKTLFRAYLEEEIAKKQRLKEQELNKRKQEEEIEEKRIAIEQAKENLWWSFSWKFLKLSKY